MKTLQACNATKLQQMEFVTLLRETTADVEAAAGNLATTDVPLKRYLKETKDRITPFETATRNPTKDPDTEVMRQKDSERDKAVSRFVLKYQSFRLSENAAEQTAYNNLQILWSRHRNVQGLNNENQTGATDNLLNDLQKAPYAAAVTTLHLETEVAGIRTTNDAFRTFMATRRATAAAIAMEETHVNKMRRELTEKYTGLCTYVVAMTDAYPDVPEWGKALAAINVIRKRYTELLTRRAAALKDKKNPKDPKLPKTPKDPKEPKNPKQPDQPTDPKKPEGDGKQPDPSPSPNPQLNPNPKPADGDDEGDDVYLPKD